MSVTIGRVLCAAAKNATKEKRKEKQIDFIDFESFI
jgi:hypothetical protein